ncbi:substrate-binding domain-containing protein [Salmonella enterica]|nr:hypothetical protein [Salmonella enterica]MDJ6957857.1 substrate-binding domain-containing protein [Salmonella enterica]MDJ7088252.1 substrate-binding domain-containing protein [Salmonella enterica]
MRILAAGSLRAVWPQLMAAFQMDAVCDFGPAGRLAAEWLINHDYTDIFIGYASYAPRLRRVNSLRVVDIPEPYNPVAEYGFACLSEQGKTLADFLLSPRARLILMQHGFS